MYECGGGGGVVMHKVNNMLYIHTKRRILKISRIWEGTTFVFVVQWIFTWFLYEFMMKPVSSSCSLFSSVLSCRRKEKKTEKEFCWLWQETRMTRTEIRCDVLMMIAMLTMMLINWLEQKSIVHASHKLGIIELFVFVFCIH